jgi:hypothetical protein
VHVLARYVKAQQMSRSFALICCLVAALAAVAAGQVEPEQTSPPLVKVDDFTAGTGATPIKFGCMLPFSGDNAVKGAAARNGIMMAITDAAKKYTMYTFTLTCKDTQCSSTNSATAASDLKKAKVVAAIGDVCSGASLPAKDNLAPILLISPSATSDTLTNSTDNFLRVSSCNLLQAPANSCRFLQGAARCCHVINPLTALQLITTWLADRRDVYGMANDARNLHRVAFLQASQLTFSQNEGMLQQPAAYEAVSVGAAAAADDDDARQ